MITTNDPQLVELKKRFKKQKHINVFDNLLLKNSSFDNNLIDIYVEAFHHVCDASFKDGLEYLVTAFEKLNDNPGFKEVLLDEFADHFDWDTDWDEKQQAEFQVLTEKFQKKNLIMYPVFNKANEVYDYRVGPYAKLFYRWAVRNQLIDAFMFSEYIYEAVLQNLKQESWDALRATASLYCMSEFKDRVFLDQHEFMTSQNFQNLKLNDSKDFVSYLQTIFVHELKLMISEQTLTENNIKNLIIFYENISLKNSSRSNNFVEFVENCIEKGISELSTNFQTS